MAATFIDVYDNLPVHLGSASHNLSSDVLKVVYHTSLPTTSWITIANVTNELSGTGYTSGGETLANVSWAVDDTDKGKLTSDSVTITAGAGGLTFSHWSIINSTQDKLICFGTCDGGSDVVLAENVPFTLGPNATNGWWRLGKGTVT